MRKLLISAAIGVWLVVATVGLLIAQNTQCATRPVGDDSNACASTAWVRDYVATVAAVLSVSNSDGTLTISPTTGAVVASINLDKANTWSAIQTFTLAPVFTDASGTRTALGLGTAATQNTGTSGATLPFLDGSNTYSGAANFTSTFQINGNTMTFPAAAATIPRTVASGAKALATGAISSATCTSAQTDTATGVATTDAIIVSFSADPTATTGYVPLTTGMLTIIYYPTADTINFKVCNNTASSITPGAVTINWRVIR